VSESAAQSSGSSAPKKAEKPAKQRTSIALFVRQVIAELRKVIWPTRPQLRTYTIVVLIFVVSFGLMISGLDILFTKGALWVFGK
jgi:preprotein translocase subunit SecE